MQPMNIAKKGLLAIEVDFLARTLEHMLHAIAMTQNLPHLRSAQVRMFDLDCATLEQNACIVNLPIPPPLPQISSKNHGSDYI